MILKIGTTTIKSDITGLEQETPAILDLSKSPYNSSGVAMSFMGNQGAGKSNVAGLICESFYDNRIPFIYFDRGVGAFGLRELGPSVVTVGNVNHHEEKLQAMRPVEAAYDPLKARRMAEAVIVKGYSLVIDCSADPDRHDMTGKPDSDDFCNHPLYSFINIMRAVYRVGQYYKTPIFIVLDESHYFAPENAFREYPIQKTSLNAAAFLAHDSRKAGIASMILGQRSTYVNKRILFGANVAMFGYHNYPDDFQRIKKNCPDISFADVKALKTGQAFLSGPKETRLISIHKRRTPNYGDTPAFVSKFETLPGDMTAFDSLKHTDLYQDETEVTTETKPEPEPDREPKQMTMLDMKPDIKSKPPIYDLSKHNQDSKPNLGEWEQL